MKKIVSFLLIVMLTMNAWTGVFADVDPDVPAVQEADTFVDIAPDVEPEPVLETEQGESGMSREDALAENSATNIAPEAAAVEGIKAELNAKGCAYFAVNYAEGTVVYADNKAETVLCELDSESAIFYTDLVEDGMLRVWFAVSGGSVMTGWLSASYGSLPLNEEEIAGMAETLPCVTATVGEKEASLFVVELKAKEAEPVEDIAPVVEGSDEEQAPEDKQDIVPVAEEEEAVDLDAGNADGAADVPDENADSASDDPAPDVSNIEPEAPVVPDENGDAEESDKISENNDTNKPVEDAIPEEIPAEQADNATDRSIEDADAAEDKKEDAPSDTADLPQKEEEVPSPEIVPVVEGSDEEQPAEEKQDVVPAEKEDDNAPAEEAKEGGFVNEPEEEPKQDNTGFVKDEDEQPEEKPAEEPVEEPKAEETKDDGFIADDEIVGALAPAADEDADIVPEGSGEIIPSRSVSIVLKNGTVPDGAAVVSSEYAADEAKRMVDKYVLGIEEQPVQLKRGGLLKSAAKGVQNIAPELTGGEEAEVTYVEGVTTKQIPGPEKTGTQTGYAVFSVGIDVNGEEYNEPGEYDVTITPENPINVRNGIREDAEIQNVTFDVYHVHNGAVDKISLSDDDVVMTAEGDVESFTYTTSDFSDFILYYTVEFSYTDPVTQITTPDFILVGSEGEVARLSEMLTFFGIYESLRNSAVEFTDDTLLYFEPVTEDGVVTDYIVHCLGPFSTEEKLTVYLESGNVAEIKVLDSMVYQDIDITGYTPTLNPIPSSDKRNQMVDQNVGSLHNSYTLNNTSLMYAKTTNQFDSSYNWQWHHGENQFTQQDTRHIWFRINRIMKAQTEAAEDFEWWNAQDQDYVYCIEPLKQDYSTNKPPSVSNHVKSHYKISAKTNIQEMNATQRAIAWICANAYPWVMPSWIQNESSFNTEVREKLAMASAQYAIWSLLGYETSSSARSADPSKPYFDISQWIFRNSYSERRGNDQFINEFNAQLGYASAEDAKYLKWLIENARAFGNKTPTLNATTVTPYAYDSTAGKYVAQVQLTSNCDDTVWINEAELPSGVAIGGGTSSGGWISIPSGTTITIQADSAECPEIKAEGYEQVLQSKVLVVFEDSGTNINEFGHKYTDLQSQVTIETGVEAKPSVVMNFRAEQIQNGAVELTKTDADSGSALAGATFRLTGSDVSYGPVDKVTGTDGKAKWDDLPAGTYTLSEVSAPTGYSITFTATNVTVTAGSTTPVSATNKAYAFVEVLKVDPTHGNKPLAGAEFEVYNSGGTKVDTLTTGADGKATTIALPFGTYTFKETKEPTGYYIDGSNTTTVTLNHSTVTPAGTYKHTRENPQITGSVTVTKYHKKMYDSDYNEKTLAGAKLRICVTGTTTAAVDADGDALPDRITGENGEASWANIPAGTYDIVEITPPEGYQLSHVDGHVDGWLTTFTISTPGQNVPYTPSVDNERIYGTVYVKKVREDDPNEPVAGAKFELLDENKSARVKNHNGNVTQELTTNNTGAVYWPDIEFGTYYIHETAGAPGYYVDTNSEAAYQKVTITEQDEGPEKIFVAPNKTIKYNLPIKKIDKVTKEPVAGIKFTVTRTAGLDFGKSGYDQTWTLTTNAQGEAKLENLTSGTYLIQELPPDGEAAHYSKTPLFSTTVVLPDSANKEVVDWVVIEAENTPNPGWIDLYKVDELNNAPMAGVKFNVYRYNNGTDIYNETSEFDGVTDLSRTDSVLNGKTPVATITTDANGYAKTGDLVKGLYVVVEAQGTTDNVPEGYRKDSRKVYTKIKVESDVTTHVTTQDKPAKNKPIEGKIVIDKIDIVTEQSLAGCVFQIERLSGIPGRNDFLGALPAEYNMTTDANGHAESKMLTYGKYRVTELTTPDHYMDPVFIPGNATTYRRQFPLDFSFEFEIVQDNSTEEHLYQLDDPYKNVPNPGWIDLYKVDDLNGNPIKNVKFDIYRYDNGTDIYKETAEFDGVDDLTKTDSVLNGKTPVTSIFTDENGHAESIDLVKGLYVVVEAQGTTDNVPEGYRKDSRKVYTNVKVVSDETTHLTTQDKPAKNRPIEGKILIDKIDILTKESLAGCVFQIERLSGIPGRDDYIGVLPEEYNMTTDASGHAESKMLTYGKYRVKEISVPEHFMEPVFNAADGTEYRRMYPVDFTFDFEIVNDNSEEEQTYQLDDPYRNVPTPGKVRLIKTDSLNENPIPGIAFEVYKYYKKTGDAEPVYGNPDTGDTVFEKTDDLVPVYVCDIVTNEEGVAESGDLEKGLYYIVEKQPTPGYLFEKVEFDEVILNSDEITPLTAVNKPIQMSITIYKRDVEEYAMDPAGEYPEIVSTDVKNAEPYEWIVGPDRTWTQTVDMPVWKTFKAASPRGDAVLTGAEFTILAEEDICDRQGNVIFHAGDTVIESIKTEGDDATIETPQLWPGKYTIKEVNPPKGYRSSDVELHVDATGAAKQSFEDEVKYQALMENEVMRSNLAITKFKGDNKVHSGDAILEIPEENAEFEVFLSSAGSYENAREYERDIVTTNDRGWTMTKELPYGTYTVHQTKGEYAYAIKYPFEEEMIKDKFLYSEIINNTEINVYVQLIKVDEETGKTIILSGVKFKLKDSEGNFITQTVMTPNVKDIDTFVTDDTGKTTLPETVKCGTYYVTEVEAPEGYLIPEGDYKLVITPSKVENDTFVLSGKTVLPVEILDTPVKGHIQIDKHGKQLIGFQTLEKDGFEYNQPIFEDRFLAGCKFEIYAREDIVGKDGTFWFEKDKLVDTITTTANGADENPLKLPLGKYYVKEVSAPAGYVYDDVEYDVELKYKDDKTPIVIEKLDIGNRYLPVEISAVKVKTHIIPDEQANGMIHQKEILLPGEGFIFGLKNKQKLTALDGTELAANSVLAVLKADAEGNLTVSGYMPHGEYYLQELKPVDGWYLLEDKFDISLTPENVADDAELIVQAVAEDIVDEEITYPVTITKTTITGDETVPGALIELYDEAGNVIYREYTDENGEIPDIELVPGKYTFKEILAPEGYELNVAIMDFEVTKEGEIIGHTTISDDYTRVKFRKVDALDGTPVEGAEFTLFDKEHKAVMTAVSDADGLVVFEKIPYGEFTIEETKPADGYDKREGSICKAFVVDGTFVNSKDEPPVVKNEPNTFFGLKVDQDNKPLAGAKFGLYDAEGKLLKEATSDKDGRFEFRRLKAGKYTVKEISAPDDTYLMSRAVVTFDLKEGTQSPKEAIGTWVNKLKRVKYIKVETSGKYLEGVEFSLIDKATGEVVEVVKSDANGVFVFTKFDYGTWIVRETKAPEGYNVIEDMEFVVDDNWTEPEPVKCIDIPNHYEFVKTDTAGNPLAGVRFALEDKEGNKLGDYVSDENGIVKVTDLKPGTYIIREIETLEGFLRTDETIEVVIDEHYIVPEEMYHLCNIPNHYEFVKIDNKGNPMPGVKFTLEDENGTLLGEYVSGEDGIVRITDLQKGKYVIREIETLEGFVKTEEAIVVEINEKYIIPEEMFRLVNYPVIKTGTALESPYLWIGVGLLVIAIAAGAVLVIKKRKTTAK